MKRDGRCFYVKYNGEKQTSAPVAWEVCQWAQATESCATGLGEIYVDDNYALLSSIGMTTQQGTMGIINKSDFNKRWKYNKRNDGRLTGNLDKEEPAAQEASSTFETCKKNGDSDCLKKYTSALGKILAASYDTNHLGKSVALLKLNNDKEVFLMGAPHRLRSTLNGEVAVYRVTNRLQWGDNGKSIWQITSSNFTQGAQMGEQFGHDIATGDFNGDGIMDYAVAAPTWCDQNIGRSKVNVGRVYIFLAINGKKTVDDADANPNFFDMDSSSSSLRDDDDIEASAGDNFQAAQVLEGFSSHGQFGFSLQSVDLNEDGIDDLVISAPFEDEEHGKIYIFNGQMENDILKVFAESPSQILKRENSYWFGHSMSLRADLDDNEYKDLAVGAPKSEEIFMYRTRPSVQLDISVTLPKEPLTFESNSVAFPCSKKAKEQGHGVCVQWKACASYSGKGVAEQLLGTIDVDLDSQLSNKRLFYLDENNQLQTTFLTQLKLQKRGNECTDELELIVKFSNSMNRVLPISVTSSLSVAVPDGDLSPIINPFSNTKDVSEINLWRNCGEDNVCQSDFTLTASKKIELLTEYATQSLTELSVDAQNMIVINSSLVVEPELSYGTRMFIQLPAGAKHSSTTLNGAPLPGACNVILQENVEILSCPLGNPLNPMVHSIITKIKVIPNGQKVNERFVLHFNNTNTNPVATEKKTFTFRNRIVKNFQAYAEPITPGKMQYDDSKDIVADDLRLTQEYTIENKGPARVKSAIILASFPRFTKGGKELLTKPINVKAVYSDDNSQIECQTVQEDLRFIPEDDDDITKRLTENQERKYTCDAYNAAKCITIQCVIGSDGKIFKPNTKYTMLIQSQIVRETIDMFKNNSVFLTEFRFLVNKDGYDYVMDAKKQEDITRKSSVRLTIKSLEHIPIPLWIIIVAAAGALLLLLIIAIICWRCGVFGKDEDEVSGMPMEKATLSANEKPKCQKAHIEEF